MGARKQIDWEKVSALYRAGVMTLREIGSQFGITEGAIRKRAKAEEWPRDLSEKIKERAEDLVRKDLVRKGTLGSNERTIIEAVAQDQATTIKRERTDVVKARALVMKLWEELEGLLENRIMFEDFGELMLNPDVSVDRRYEAYQKVIGFGGRVEAAKKLSEALQKLVSLERDVYGLSKGDGDEKKSFTVTLHPKDVDL